MSDEGILTLQSDQMNVIAHHIHNIRMKQDLWPDKDPNNWPMNIDSHESIEEQIRIAKLQRRN